MKLSIFLFITLFLLAILSKPVKAQPDKINISGFVKDAVTGEALIGANILIYKDTLNFSLPPFSGAAANSYGFYVIPNVSKSNYYLIARYIGYKTVIREINIQIDKETITINIEMNSVELRLDEVVVEGKKDEKNNISTIDISPGLIEKLPSLSGEVDLFRTLQMLPGVKAANEISNGLYIRGGSPDQTLTLVDGVTVYNPSHLGNIASSFNSNALQNVRLIKGAFPAEYGGRLSSILDIKLRSGTKEREKGIIGFGLINSHAVLEGPLNENATYMISGRAMYYDFFQKNFDNSTSIPRYNFHDFNTKLNYNISNNSIISISALYSKDKIYNPPANDLDYDIEWQNTSLSLNWLHISSRSLFLSSTLSYINYDFKSIIGSSSSSLSASNYFSNSTLTDFYFRQNAELKWHRDHTFKTGIELGLHNYDLLYSDFYDRILERDPFAGSDISSIEAAIYFQTESQITSRLKTNAGVRFYYFGEKKFFRVEPRISLSYALNENLYLKAAFASANQFLHLIVRNDISLPTDLWYPSTKKIEPSKSTQYVFGIDSYFSDQEYLVSLEGYYNDMKQLYEFKNFAKLNPFDNSIEDQFTSGNGEAYGAELFINKREGNLTGWIGYTLSWTRRQFAELNNGKVFYPRYDRLHDVSIVVSYKIFNDLEA
ncbi:MAG: TonB-dependent receptor, partial [Ignavibacteriaceae bacterium]